MGGRVRLEGLLNKPWQYRILIVIVGWACFFAHVLKPNVVYLAKAWAKKHAHPTTDCLGLLRSYETQGHLIDLHIISRFYIGMKAFIFVGEFNHIAYPSPL